MTVQEIADAVARDLRERVKIGAVGTDFDLLVSWIDRVHKDVLHTCPVWQTFMLTSDTFQSTPNGSPYILPVNDIRRFVTLHDLANRRTLIPFEDFNYPAATSSSPPERTGKPNPPQFQTQESSKPYPQYYIPEMCIELEDGTVTQGLHLWPDPLTTEYAGTIRFWYIKLAPTLDASADILLVDDDGKDIMCAGVNALAFQYYGYANDAAYWTTIYNNMKRGF